MLKRKPSADEWTLVESAYAQARMVDIESILREFEPKVLEKRDAVYARAQKRGVTEASDDKDRLAVVGEVVEYLFHNVEPPDEYTKRTDINHFKEVASLAVQAAKHRSTSAVTLTLILSCWMHDIERFIPSTKCKYLPEAVDSYRKRLIHPMTSARVALCILRGSPVSEREKERIRDIIVQHDKPLDERIVINGKVLLDRPAAEIRDELALLMDADSLAFFRHTVGYFVETKAKKYSPDWMWTRILTNVRRLRGPLRLEAAHYMEALSDEIKMKMGWIREEVYALCPSVEETRTSPIIAPASLLVSPSVSKS
jgi:hypothetical protein